MARILVIDDSPTVGLAVRNALANDGHTVERVASFVDLPRALSDNEPELILLDIEMAGFSGLTVGAFLAERQQGKERIPILIYSDQPVEKLEMVAEAVGAIGFVGKGEGSAYLRERVRRVLRGAESKAASRF